MLASDRVLLSPLIEPTHYSLELSPDFTTLEFDCNEEINLIIKEENISEISFHSKEINVKEVSFKSSGNAEVMIVCSVSCVYYF